MSVLTYTPKEASKALSVSVATVYRWMDDGTLPVVMLGKRRMIHVERLRQKLDADCAGSKLITHPAW